MIYGPYKSNGDFWGCDDHDICNGTFIDGNYVYVSTSTFPYILGCFGPGAAQEYSATCSSYSCSASSYSYSGGSSGSSSDSGTTDAEEEAAIHSMGISATAAALIALIYL